MFRLFISRVKKIPDWENTVIRNQPANPLLGLRAIPTANPSHDHPIDLHKGTVHVPWYDTFGRIKGTLTRSCERPLGRIDL